MQLKPTKQPSLKLQIDFTAVSRCQKRIGDLAAEVTLEDLKAATEVQIAEMESLIHDLHDTQVVFVATDPEAEDGIGWSAAHLIAHVTANSEEGAALSWILARGMPILLSRACVWKWIERS